MAWSALGDSVIGTSHRALNLPCQDAFRFSISDDGNERLVIVVADGAGSALRSQVGATLACDELVRRLESIQNDTPLTFDGMVALFSEVRGELVKESERLAVGLRELACTALVAIVDPNSGIFAQIGDGAIVLGDGASYRTVFWPEPTEYVNETDFLTDDQFAKFIQFTTTGEPIVELAMFTDGLQRLVLNIAARSPYSEFFRPLFAELRNAPNIESLFQPFHEFLDSDRVNARTDDDKTLVLALRQS